MNKKKIKAQILLASLLASGAAWAQTSPTPFVMTTPVEYYIQDMSPNGKWACGVYSDYNNSTYGFRWNLETDEIEVLDASGSSYAQEISNDGTVVGSFTDNSYRSNGAAISMAGYWKDNKWNRLEMPAGINVGQASASSISPDGHYITGSVSVNSFGDSSGYIWKDGKLYRELQSKNGFAKPFAVSPDGQSAAGWVWNDNRQPVMWNADGSITVLPGVEESPFTVGRKFSPDGKLLLFYGGWNIDENDPANDRAIGVYNLETKELKTMSAPSTNATVDFFDVSNNGTVIGQCDEGLRAGVWIDGTGYFADEWLMSKGVDLDAAGVMKDAELGDYYQLTQGLAVSEDDSAFGFRYISPGASAADSETKTIAYNSMVVKFNAQKSAGLAPLSVKANQLDGISSVNVSWRANVLADGITGYNVYRDGVKVNSSAVNGLSFIDTDVENGDHKYTVTALYGSTESAKSEEATATVKEKELQAPNAPFAMQRSYNNAYMEWTMPYSNYASLSYFDVNDHSDDTFGFNGTGIAIEIGIKYDESMLAAYRGQQVKAVGFYPTEKQGGWTISLYTHDVTGRLRELYSQTVSDDEVEYGKYNIIKLNTPVAIPSTGDLIIANSVTMTEASNSVLSYDASKGTNGYSDLLRIKTEADLYSFGDLGEESNYMYRCTWNISAIMAPAGVELTKDEVASYNIYDGDKLVANTKNLSYEIKGLSAGTHTLGISAVYADNTESAKTTTAVDIKPDASQLEKVGTVYSKPTGAAESNTMKFEWLPVKSMDNTSVQYCIDNPKLIQSVQAPAEYNEYSACSMYRASMFKGREGYEIRSFRFYPTADAAFTAKVYKGDEQICEYEIEDYTLDGWNEYTLPTPIKVEGSTSYSLVIDCYDMASGASCIGVDDQMNLYGYSDLVRLGGDENYTSFQESMVYGNWMMALGLVNPNANNVEATAYDVNIDGEKKNAEPLAATAFDYSFGTKDNRAHTVTVDAYYPVAPTAVEGEINVFYIGVDGISENVIQTISIQKGDNVINVTGDNVKSVDIYSASGAEVAGANGNSVSINGLSAGVYVVKANVGGKTISRKIMIEK